MDNNIYIALLQKLKFFSLLKSDWKKMFVKDTAEFNKKSVNEWMNSLKNI